jgi:hypothetical protein
LCGPDKGLAQLLRLLQQAAVRADQIVIEQARTLHEGEAVAAGVGSVEDAEAIDAAGSVEVRPRRDVYQNFFAEKGHEHLVARELVFELALEVEAAVLYHQRNVGDTNPEIERTGELFLIVILHD